MENQIEQIAKIVDSNRLLKDRILQLEKLGFFIERVRMGSGGVNRAKKMRDGTTRVQISCGYGKYNYAYAVILK